MVSFLATDNSGADHAVITAHNQLIQNLAKIPDDKVFIKELTNAPAKHFLRTYLRNRHRYYDGPPVPGTGLEELDRGVLELLVRFYKPRLDKAKELLDAPSLVDLASLFGPSNASTTSDIIRAACRSTVGMRFELQSALQVTAAVLSTDVPAALAASETEEAVGDVLAYLCDATHSTALLLALSPHASYAMQPAGSVHDGPSLMAEDCLFAALVRTYEHTIPAVAVQLAAVGGGAIGVQHALRLRVAAHSCLSALNAILDTCYVCAIRAVRSSGRAGVVGGGVGRGTQAGGDEAGEGELRTGSRCDAACVGRSLHSIVGTWVSLQPGPFARDLCAAFKLGDVVAGLIAEVGAAGLGLEERQKNELVRWLSDLAAAGGSAGAGPGGTVTRAKVDTVREILPEADIGDVERALSLADGDVTAAIERLMAGSGGGGVYAAGGGDGDEDGPEGGAFPTLGRGTAGGSDRGALRGPWAAGVRGGRASRSGPAVPADLRARTLALAQAQVEEAFKEAEEREVAAALGLPPGRKPPPPTVPIASAAASLARAAARDQKRAAKAARGGGGGGMGDHVAVPAREFDEEGEGGGHEEEEDGRGPLVLLRPEYEYEDELDDAFEAADLLQSGGLGAGEDPSRERGGGRVVVPSRAPAGAGAGRAGPPAAAPPPAPGGYSSSEGDEQDGDGEGEGAVRGYAYDSTADPALAGYANMRAGGASVSAGVDRGRGRRIRGAGRGRGSSTRGGGAAAGVPLPAPEGHGPRAQGGLTERDAERKRENKARGGNHNRKRGADKKMARGMA